MGIQKREKIAKYGKIIVDFLNAKDINDAFFQLLDNVEQVFAFEEGLAKNLQKRGFFLTLEAKPKDTKDTELKWLSPDDHFYWNTGSLNFNEYINTVIKAFIYKTPRLPDQKTIHFFNGQPIEPFYSYLDYWKAMYELKCTSKLLLVQTYEDELYQLNK